MFVFNKFGMTVSVQGGSFVSQPFLAEVYTIFHITSYGMAVDQLFTMCMLCLCKMCVLIRVHLISVPTALAVYHFPLEPCVLCDVLH